MDLTTGTATGISDTGINLLEGLALSPSGVLYATSDSATLYTLRTTTVAIISGSGSTGLGDVEGLAFSGSTPVVTNFTSNPTGVYSLNTTTASPTLLTGEPSCNGG